MNQMTHQLPMDPPKFLCLPARPLVCGLAVFGAVRSFIQFWMTKEFGVELTHACVFFLDMLLLFGALKNNVTALKWSQRVVFCCIIIAILSFLIYPVLFASLMASGVMKNATDFDEHEIEVLSNVTTAEQHFVLGLVSGFTLELATGISIGLECLKYVMVHRLWEYAKATEACNAPDRYTVP